MLSLNLLQNIDVQEKLREELRSQIPFVDNLTYDDISKCKYLDAVIKETLRIHSPVPLTNRQNNKSVVIGKYNIPAGTLIRASNVSAHMNENTYPEPYAFKPERFLSGVNRFLNKINFIQKLKIENRICAS